MSFRSDLDAAHARIDVLEAEVARLEAECAELRQRNAELEVDAEVGRKVRVERTAGFSEERLAEKMKREEAEVRAKVRKMLGQDDD
jgi:hypothetical protein